MVQDGPIAMQFPCVGLKNFPFTIQSISPITDLVVYQLPTGELDGSEVKLNYGVDYTITGSGKPSPATTVITTTLAYDTPSILIITRATKAERLADYDDFAPAPMNQVDLDLDRLYMIMQEKTSGDQVLVIPGTCTEITGYSNLLPTESAVHVALDNHANDQFAHNPVVANTPNTGMRRDGSGRTQIADGVAANDAVNKQQLDTEINNRTTLLNQEINDRIAGDNTEIAARNTAISTEINNKVFNYLNKTAYLSDFLPIVFKHWANFGSSVINLSDVPHPGCVILVSNLSGSSGSLTTPAGASFMVLISGSWTFAGSHTYTLSAGNSALVIRTD